LKTLIGKVGMDRSAIKGKSMVGSRVGNARELDIWLEIDKAQANLRTVRNYLRMRN
jgi:hypothetical protein